MRPARIEVEIDELRLTGVPARHRHRIADAFQSELGLLLSERGLPADSTAMAESSVPLRLNWTGDTTAEQMGRSLAHSIYESWTGPR
jgi:hypothetical protein